MKPMLQSRWHLEGQDLVYYGLRQPPNLFRQKFRLDRHTALLVASLDGVRPISAYSVTPQFATLLQHGVVVDRSEVRALPRSLDEACYCVHCAANDYAIPGLELDEDGVCPMCRTQKQYGGLKNVIPVLATIPRSPDKKYDAAVFYTGGKDSSYLLYYMSRVLKLRILALCWETPFMSDWARESVDSARKALSNVDFLVEKAPVAELTRIYQKAYALQGNVCICPSVAYVLFFERMAEWEVPYLVLGNEPSQCRNLIYNHMAPPFYFHALMQNAARFFFNLGRALMLRKPFSAGQMELYMTVKQLAFGRSSTIKLLKYRNELVENTCAALAEAPEFLAPFQKAVQKSGKTARLPALIHIDFDDASESGVYDWNGVKSLLAREIGWVDAPVSGKGLHTSCKIERCKEWTQLRRFRDMETHVIPFSAIELALASASGSISREQAIEELKRFSGFSEEPPEEIEIMNAALKP